MQIFYQIEQNKNIVVGINCVQNGEKPYIEWFYDQDGYFSYILINGDSYQKDYVVRRLEDHNIISIRTGKSYKQASNGKKYDWFLRVYYFPNKTEISAGIPPTREQVYEVFNKYFILHKDKYSELEFKYNELELQAKLIKDENSRLYKKIDSLKDDLKYKELKLSSSLEVQKLIAANSEKIRVAQIYENSKLKDHIEKLKEDFLFFQNNIDDNRDLETKLSQLNSNFKNKQQEIADWEKTSSDFLKENEKLQFEKTKVENERDIAVHEKNKLVDWLKDRDFNNSKSVNNNKNIDIKSVFRGENALGKILIALFENLNIARRSVAFLSNEVKNPLPAIKLLKMLNYHPEEVVSRKVKCAEGWNEVHYSVGANGDSGRLYYAKTVSGPTKYMVYISHKDTQAMDFDILKNIKIS